MHALQSYVFIAMILAVASNEQEWTSLGMDHPGYLQPQNQQFQLIDAASGDNFRGRDHGQGYEHGFGSYAHSLGGYEHGLGGYEHGLGGSDIKPQSYPVHQHVEEENPEPIKHYKEILVPVHKNVEFKIHQPILIPVPHPVPIQVPVPKAIVIPIFKEVSIPVEKSVPYPVEKLVHVPKIKEVPFEVIKHVIVPVEKPVPFKVPVYETIIHSKKGSHKIR